MHIFRIEPEKGLVESILKYCEENKIKSGIILQTIGSLKKANLSFTKSLSGKRKKKKFVGPFELTSGQGTIALKKKEIILHLHVSLGSEEETISGHILPGSMVFSTAEVIIGETLGKIKRKKDEKTGADEII